MSKTDDFLIELHTEELPPKSLLKLSQAFCKEIADGLNKNGLAFSKIQSFATPRRLAVLATSLTGEQAERIIEKRGPALAAAFDEAGQPTPACIGFARSLGVTPAALIQIKNAQGVWVGYQQNIPGKSVAAILPDIIKRAIDVLPIAKRMRWGAGDAEFVRPVHAMVMLYGDKIIPCDLFNLPTGRVTEGHRFYAPGWINIPHAANYASLLEAEGCVIADFEERRQRIREAAIASAKKIPNHPNAQVLIDAALLDEVTGLVEWPTAFFGQFDETFLSLPREVLVSAMQDHQRYFPVANSDGQLLPYFILISNIGRHESGRIVHGNERVLRARLADAAFFYMTDKKEALADRLPALKGMVMQAKLGTLYDKSARLASLCQLIGGAMQIDSSAAARAGALAKCDLTTLMVNEFPELQGVMGAYYAAHDGEPMAVAMALKEQYLPRFSGDDLPKSDLGIVLALADRIDLLVGYFGLNLSPKGDKDPFGLRRAAIAVLRILTENNIHLDLEIVLDFAMKQYGNRLENAELIPGLLHFIAERMRTMYAEQGIGADVFAAVNALHIANPCDVDARLKAVKAFKQLTEAEALTIANKRVSNILNKYTEKLQAKKIDSTLFESAAEIKLAQALKIKNEELVPLYALKHYDQILLALAQLRQPIDDFFDEVMVMVDDTPRRENRILLLMQLRELFLRVADIALLQ